MALIDPIDAGFEEVARIAREMTPKRKQPVKRYDAASVHKLISPIPYPTNFDGEVDSVGGQLPIPRRTRKRAPRTQDAARLYIHARITNFRMLSDMVGVSYANLKYAAKHDKWEEFAACLHTDQIKSVFRRDSPLKQQLKFCNAMVDELDQKLEVLHALQKQREKLLEVLDKEAVTGTKWGAAMLNMSKVNKEIDALLNMSDMKKQIASVVNNYEEDTLSENDVDIIIPSV